MPMMPASLHLRAEEARLSPTVKHALTPVKLDTLETLFLPLSLMAKHFQLLSLLLTILFTTHSLSQPTQFLFNGFKHHTNLTLSGIAKIQSNGLIALTNHTSRLIGRAFYPTLIHFKPSPNGTVSSFSTSFAFAIVPEYSKLGGHGLAFVIGPDKYLENGLPSQYLGLLNPNTIGNFSKHLFAVEFDTVQDFEFKDINDNHVGIDLNDLKSNISVSAGYFMDGNNLSAQPLNLKSGDTILTWVDYDSEKTELNVTLSLSSMKPGLPILSVKIDLSLIFKEFMYVGFSSSTGLLASSHYLQGWSFNMNGQAQSLHLSSLPSLPGRKPVNTGLIIGVSLSALIFMVLAIGIVYYFTRKMKKDDVIEDWELEVGPHRFSYKELKKATRGFRDEELLGFGGFGKVYRGVISGSDNEVAIKRISNESKQGLREFVSEIASIGRLRHRNLVQLLGWCRNKSELLLVYDFMPNGSLDKYLFEEPISILSWDERFRIIKCVASGLLYLHEEWEQAVIHRDIKAGNVLLDADMNGRLGDFGLSKLYEHGSNPNTTKVVGTLGYLAPELTRTGRPTTNSDVFSFGALVLEVVCGRRPIEPKALPEELILVDWVWDRWRTGAIFEVVDKRLEGEYDDAEVVVATKIGLMCSSDVAEERPSMRQVFRYLEGERRLPEVLGASGGGGDGKKGGGGSAAQPEFEDFVHS